MASERDKLRADIQSLWATGGHSNDAQSTALDSILAKVDKLGGALPGGTPLDIHASRLREYADMLDAHAPSSSPETVAERDGAVMAMREVADAIDGASPSRSPPEPDPMYDNPPTSLYEFAQRGYNIGASPSVGDRDTLSNMVDRESIRGQVWAGVWEFVRWRGGDGQVRQCEGSDRLHAVIGAALDAVLASTGTPTAGPGITAEERWAITECLDVIKYRDGAESRRIRAALGTLSCLPEAQAPCPDTGYPCNQSCEVRCAKTCEILGGAPRVGEAPQDLGVWLAGEAGKAAATANRKRADGNHRDDAWFSGRSFALLQVIDRVDVLALTYDADERAKNNEQEVDAWNEWGKRKLSLDCGGQDGGSMRLDLDRLLARASAGTPTAEPGITAVAWTVERLGATPPAEPPEQPEGYSFRRGPDSVVVERFNENGEAVAMFLVQPNDGPFKTTHIKIEGDRAAYDFAMGLLARTKGATHRDQPSDAQRYRAALEHIANGGLSPCLTFAQLILAGHTLLDAHRADCARADRVEYTLPDPPPFAPGAPEPLLVPPAAAREHALSGLAKVGLAAAEALLSVPAPKDGDTDGT